MQCTQMYNIMHAREITLMRLSTLVNPLVNVCRLAFILCEILMGCGTHMATLL